MTEPQASLSEIQYRHQLATSNKDHKQIMSTLYLLALAQSNLNKNGQMEVSIEQGLALSNKLGNAKYRILFMILQSEVLDRKGLWQQAYKTITEGLALARRTNDDRLIAETLLSRGSIRTNGQDYDGALEDMLTANALFRKHNDRRNIGISLSNIAVLYDATDDYEKAIQYYLQSIEYDDKEDLYTAAVNHINLGKAYTGNKELVKAERHLQQALKIAKIIDDAEAMGYALFRLGELWMVKDRPEQTLSFLERALPLFQQLDDLLMQFNCRIGLADAYIALNNNSASSQELAAAEQLYDQLEIKGSYLLLLDSIADNYTLIGDYKAAYDVLQKRISVMNNLQEKAQDSRMEELKVRFEMVQQENLNKSLQNDNLRQRLTIKDQQTRQWTQLAVLGIFGLVLIFTYSAYLKQKSHRKEMARLALEDELTGVSNRRHILSLAEIELERAKRHKLALTFVLIDLDHFKIVNDRYGHQAGDATLKHFASICKENIRLQDRMGRVGGEEWLIFFPHTNHSEVIPILTRIQKAYAASTISGVACDYSFTFSAGISEFRAEDDNLEQVLARADLSLYQAKAEGRDQFVYYEQSSTPDSPFPEQTP